MDEAKTALGSVRLRLSQVIAHGGERARRARQCLCVLRLHPRLDSRPGAGSGGGGGCLHLARPAGGVRHRRAQSDDLAGSIDRCSACAG